MRARVSIVSDPPYKLTALRHRPGGALYVAGAQSMADTGFHEVVSNMTLIAVRVIDAKAKYKGGAVFVGENSHVIARNSHIEKGSAVMGGGLYVTHFS